MDVPADGVVRALTLPEPQDLGPDVLREARSPATPPAAPWTRTSTGCPASRTSCDWEKNDWFHVPVTSHADLTALARLPATRLSVSARRPAATPEGREAVVRVAQRRAGPGLPGAAEADAAEAAGRPARCSGRTTTSRCCPARPASSASPIPEETRRRPWRPRPGTARPPRPPCRAERLARSLAERDLHGLGPVEGARARSRIVVASSGGTATSPGSTPWKAGRVSPPPARHALGVGGTFAERPAAPTHFSPLPFGRQGSTSGRRYARSVPAPRAAGCAPRAPGCFVGEVPGARGVDHGGLARGVGQRAPVAGDRARVQGVHVDGGAVAAAHHEVLVAVVVDVERGHVVGARGRAA